MEETVTQVNIENNGIKRNDKGLFVKGTSGGPGRTKGKTMKEYVKEYLAAMTEEQKIEWLEGLSKEVIWKMAEGQPHQAVNVEGNMEVKIVSYEDAKSTA